MEIRLLGPVDVQVGGRRLDLGPPQRRAVLAAVAVDAPRAVPMDVLVDRIWGERPPAQARSAVRVHVAHLRRALGEPDVPPGTPPRILRRAGGYVLEVESAELDLLRFRWLTAAAREPSCGQPDRLRLLDEALGLWRGVPLAGVGGDWAGRMRETCNRERLDAAVAWARAGLLLGRHDAVIARVRTLMVTYPLAEPLAAALMRALAATGRAGEALDVFAVSRAQLAEALGAEPAAELRALHVAILRGGIDTVSSPAAEPVPSPAAEPVPPGDSVRTRVVPAQLPADVPIFTGRAAELSELDTVLPDHPGGRAAGVSRDWPTTAVVISALSGTAGVGKTALAVHWAHRMHDRFPDGQLYVDLRGYDHEQPLLAGDALAGFLRALGVSGQDIPADLQERAARYRTESAGRRMLLLLDNAASLEQVRPLLPGTPSCLVLVTSRDSLAGLVALHGARRIDLDVLSLSDSVTLLRRLVGDRVEADPGAAAAIAEQCARLPLALRVAAELACFRPAAALAELVRELADRRRRLDLLDAAGDRRAAVRVVFSWSYQHLPDDAARAFRLLGLYPGPDVDPYAVAALADADIDTAGRLLDLLSRAHLIHPTQPARYGTHDLLRAYAADLARQKDNDDQRRAALTRLFDYYQATAAAAMDTVHPARQHLRPRVPPAATPSPPVDDPAAARAWLDAERPSLVAVISYTAGRGWPAHTARLAATLFVDLDTGGHYADATSIYTHAHRAACQTADEAGQAWALTYLGVVSWRLGQLPTAAEQFEQALALHRNTADGAGEARACTGLGLISIWLGRYEPGLAYLKAALALHRERGDQIGEAAALTNLGSTYERLGRLRAALDHSQRSLELSRRTGNRDNEAAALTNLAVACSRLGGHQTAVKHLDESLRLYRSLGHLGGEATALIKLGSVYERIGRHRSAAEHQRQALTISRRIGYRRGEAEALNGLGEALRAAGDPAEARRHHAAAQALAIKLGDAEEQARADAGLADVG